MSKPVVFNWPAPSDDSICLLQNTAGAGNLVIDGGLSDTKGGIFPPSVTLPGIVRTISLTSLNNLSADNFTITGTFQGQVQTETIAGPNANTVYTTRLFDSVTAVSVNGAVNGISVGTGDTGRTQWFRYDHYRPYPNISAQVIVSGTINYSGISTLDDVQTNDTPEVFPGFCDLDNETTNQLSFESTVNNYAAIRINSSTDGSLVATIMQMGVI